MCAADANANANAKATDAAVLDCGQRDGLVAKLLLLAEDLELQELLLLLQEAGVRRVHRHLVELLLLVGRDVLMVLQLLHPRLGLFAPLAAVFIDGQLGQALLQPKKEQKRKKKSKREHAKTAEGHLEDI